MSEQLNPGPTDITKEDAAQLAHRLWTHWSQHIADEEDISEDRLERWRELWIPFYDLPAAEQNTDRELVERYLSERPDYDQDVKTTDHG